MTALLSTGPFSFTNSILRRNHCEAKNFQWPRQDYIRYAVFLNFFKNEYPNWSVTQNGKWPFYRNLSIFIQSKNPNQCRIFHKKMMTDCICIQELIANLRAQISGFQEHYQNNQSSLINIRRCLNKERDFATKDHANNYILQKEESINSVKDDSQSDSYDHKVKEELKPTDIDYLQQKIESPVRKVNQNKFNRPKLNFSNFNNVQNCYQQTSINHDLNNWANCQKKGKQRTQEEITQWNDCHNGFVMYMTKLNLLLHGSNHCF